VQVRIFTTHIKYKAQKFKITKQNHKTFVRIRKINVSFSSGAFNHYFNMRNKLSHTDHHHGPLSVNSHLRLHGMHRANFTFTFPTVSSHLHNYVALTYRQDIYLIEIRINCCPLSESCSWNDPMIFPCSWSLIHFMCVHMNCKQIIQVFFTPLATKDKKFTASLES
jgi:hypothetical protein